MSGPFTTQIRNWARNTDQNMNLAFEASVFDLVEEINRPINKGGRMPVKTGYLRSSVSASSVGTPKLIPQKRSEMAWRAAVTNAVRGSRRTGKLWLAWTAPHANRMNFGFVGYDSLGRYYRQVGLFFIDYGTAKWSQIFRSNLQTLRRIR